MKPGKKKLEKKQGEKLSAYLIIGGGILLPSITIFVILLFGIPIGHNLLPHPQKNVMRIDVIGHQWFWEIHYPDNQITLKNELHLPLKQPIDFYVTSDDVIHSFWIPRLNGKIDAIPGHVNILRLQATKPGNLRGQCAEFCGVRHAKMVLKITVHNDDSFKLWLQQAHSNFKPSKNKI